MRLKRFPTLALLWFGIVLASFAQSSTEPLTFDVASVRQSTSNGEASSNVPLGPGNVYSPTGGLLQARHVSLLTYIAFAWRMTDAQLDSFRSQAPSWVADTDYDIEARTEQKNITKDQLRLMMRSLLQERFHLALHEEIRQVSIFALQLDKPGTLGPNLRIHPDTETCPSTLPQKPAAGEKPAPETISGAYPYTCGGILMLPPTAAQYFRLGGRNIPLKLLAGSLSGWGALGKAVHDETGLSGSYDFSLEYVPDPRAAEELGGPTFLDALKKQLGLKLTSQKGTEKLLILDHIDHVTEN